MRNSKDIMSKVPMLPLTAGLLFVLSMVVGIPAGPYRALAADTCSSAACHPGIVQYEYAHAPVAEGDCLACHTRKADIHPDAAIVAFSLAVSGKDLCYQCHDKVEQGKFVHAPVLEGDCTACHNPHGANNKSLLATEGGQGEICFQCHDKAPFDLRFGHGPVAAGACSFCHSPHASDRKGFLREDSKELCFTCHDDFAEGFKKAKFIHSAVLQETCTSCHLPHGSNYEKILNREAQTICFSCHEDLKLQIKRARSDHSVVSDGKRCSNCHRVHFSDSQKLMLQDEVVLCLGCHSQEDTTKSGGVRNILNELTGKKFLHGPLAEKQCVPCHDPHGSGFSKLLRGPYPGDIYAPYKEGLYDFCFTCHDQGMLENRETTTDTNFRNGRQNLHFLHVANVKKGRTCQTCHASHASDGAMMISLSGTPFGSWSIPIRFEKSEAGGSCTPGCHRELKYDRQNAANNREEFKASGPSYVEY